MKKFMKVGFVLAAMAITLTSCDCFKKISKNVSDIRVSCTPTILTLKGDAVNATYTIEFPAKMFSKKAVVKITPVLVYEGGEIAGTPKYLQGEKVKDNYTVVSYKQGGSVSGEVSFPYKPEAKLSTLVLRVEGKCCKDCKKKPKDFIALPEEIEVAKGISTVQLLADDFAQLAYAPDNFKRVTTITNEAKIMFQINRANVRPAQLTSEEIKTLEDFIKENYNQPKKTLSDLYTKAYASPDGPVDFNDELSVKRGKNTQEALAKKFKKDNMPVEPTFDVDALGEDWDGFKELVQASDIPEKDVILQILQMYSDPVKRDEEIKNMSSVFKILAEKILPELRRSKLIMNVDVEGLSDDELKAAVANNVSSLNIEEMLYAATLYTDNQTKATIYAAATKKYSSCWRAWNNLGVVLAKEGKVNEAKSAIAKSAQINSSAPEVANNLGVIALFEGNKAEAKKFFSAINTPEAKYNLGLVNLAEGNYDAAVKVLNGYNLAVAEVCNGNLPNAKAILARENSAQADYLKAIIAAKEGDQNGVISNLKAAIAKDPSYAEKAGNEVEFTKYFDNSEFIAIAKVKPSKEVKKAVETDAKAAKKAAKAAKKAEKKAAKAAKKAAK